MSDLPMSDYMKCATSHQSIREMVEQALFPLQTVLKQLELLEDGQLDPDEAEYRRNFLTRARALLSVQPPMCPRFAGQKVLVALEAEARAEVCRWLHSLGLETQLVEDCPAAYRAALQANRLGMVLLDERLEGYQGRGTLQSIRQAGGAPVVLLSETRPTSADGWWTRPEDPQQLLPLLERFLNPGSKMPSKLDGRMGRQHPLKVLIAEDLALNQKLITLLLSRLGYPADAASNGYEVMLKVEKEDYDLILMDLNMPGMNGLEAASRVRQLKPLEAGGPRLVAMSANLPNGTPEGSGFEEFLAKPVQLDSLQAILRNCPPRTCSCERSLPVLDPGIVENLQRLGDQEFLESLIDDAAQELPQMLGLLMDSWQRRETSQVVQLAHAIKGSASTLGALRVARLAGQLEELGKTGELTGDGLNELETAMEEALSRLQEPGQV